MDLYQIKRDTGLYAMSGLEGLGIVANVIAVVNLSLKVISWCSKYAQDVKNSHDGRARLLQAAITLHYESEKVRDLLSRKGSKLQASQRLYHAIGSSEVQLRELERQLSQKDNRSSLKWPLQKDKIESAIQNIEKSTKTMIDMLQVNMADLLVSIDDRAEAEEQRATIDQLPYVGDAVWDSHTEERNAKCLPNTRESVLKEVELWVKDTTEQSKTVFWLNGMAGTGKSTISRTISQLLSQDGRLGATFFFKRGEADRGGISKMMPTIAHQLVMNQPALRPYVHAAVRDNPTITSKSVSKQFNALVSGPLEKGSGDFPSNSSIAIVIDALDECGSETDIRLIVSLFSKTKTIRCPRPRVFITSRPDLPVRLGFQDVEGSYRDLVLHNIPAPVIEQDISTFFHHKMKLIQEDWNVSVEEKRKLPQNWPGSERIQELTKKSLPLFIFAATACRFISDRQLGSPEKQLCRFLEYQTEGTTTQLESTYRPVLTQLFSSKCSKASERRIILEFRCVVGTIINLFDPLSTSALSRLLDVDQDIIDSKLDLLHSVLDVPSSPEPPVRMLHLSFRDYLVSLETREHQFWIDEKKSARNLVKDCLRVMETLRSDICRLKNPGTPRSTLKPDFINACIPPELQYACLYWVNHQVAAGSGPEDATRILKFLKQHLLHWIEAMSLLGKAFEVTELMRTLRSMMAIESKGHNPELIDFLDDTIRFVDIDAHTVNVVPLQIYYSLLVLAPSNSIARQTFAAKVPTCVTLLIGQVANWDSRLRSLASSDELFSDLMVFSPDSQSLCFISESGHLQVWTCGNGECVHDIEPEPERYFPIITQDNPKVLRDLFSFSRQIVSPDAKSMAAIVERERAFSLGILIFDLTTSQVLCAIPDRGSFETFAFSRDSKFLWSCARDGQVCVWDVSTGTCVEKLDCPVKPPSNTRMLFSLADPKVLVIRGLRSAYVWYLDTSKVNEGLTIEWPQEAAFRHSSISPDGRLLVAPSSEDLSLVVWDISTRELLWKLSTGQDSTGMMFSPESTFLMTKDIGSIRIWDMRDGKCCKVIVLRIHDISRSMTFSPDAKYLIAVDDRVFANQAWLWDINTATPIRLNMHQIDTFNPCPFLFSPDGMTLVSKAYDGSIRLWDWAKLLKEPSKTVWEVLSILFSPDSSIIAALFGNGNINIWDTTTGVQLYNFSDPFAKFIVFSPDSSFIATVPRKTAPRNRSAKIWNLHEPDHEWQSDGNNTVDFSPNSQNIVTTRCEPSCITLQPE
ncbi:vegetative incompatibility het-e-1 [Fusarium sporotrichioides]|uniref:Mitochondrial division protein 1 n=1 Tax=Fusarium sporotrichioides TaxID=5514 RepID=A0A395SDL4_FUSSP|nr:vegetative incompatibility het-e-1 [Fusarium sporotrichioides]